MKNIVSKYKHYETKVNIIKKNQISDLIYIYKKLGYSNSKIFESIYLNQFRYRKYQSLHI